MDNMQSNDQTEALENQQGQVADQSRRNFLKAAAVASAAVVVAGGAAGFRDCQRQGALAVPELRILASWRAANASHSNQGAKFGGR